MRIFVIMVAGQPEAAYAIEAEARRAAQLQADAQVRSIELFGWVERTNDYRFM